MSFQNILLETADGVARLTLNRPQTLNSLNKGLIDDIRAALRALCRDAGVRALIITGAGRGFCAGADLAGNDFGDGVQRSVGEGVSHSMEIGYNPLVRELAGFPKPVICAVNGFAIGGGHVIHVICDVTIAAEHAKFGQAGPRVGSFDAGWGSAYLARTVGEKRAREIWFFCQQYDAQTALQWGLVNKVVPGDKLMAEAREMAKKAVALSPTALKFLKHAFNADSSHIFGQAKMAADGLASFVNSEEASEGRNAFLEKRTPDFSGFR